MLLVKLFDDFDPLRNLKLYFNNLYFNNPPNVSLT